MSSALEANVFLRLPGQWETGLWADAALGTGGLYYNVYRWYEPESGRYVRPDPIGILRAVRTAHLFSYADGSPLILQDYLGLDALTSDPDVLDCFFCLLRFRAFGHSELEKAAWVTQDTEGNFGCVTKGWESLRGKARWPASRPIPDGSKAFAHTHPTRSRSNRSLPQPSGPDKAAADAIGRPVYTVTPEGIWKYDPSTGIVTLEEPANWFHDPQQRCAKNRCKEILQ